MNLLNQFKKQVFNDDVDASAATPWIDATGLTSLSLGVSFLIGDGVNPTMQVECTNEPQPNDSTNGALVGSPTVLTVDGESMLEILQPSANFYRLTMIVDSGVSTFVVNALGKGPA